MRWASAVSERSDTLEAIGEVVSAVRETLDADRADALFLFATAEHVVACADLAARVKKALSAEVLVGCTGAGVIGGGREIEQRRALSLTAAVLPDVELASAHLVTGEVPDADGWHAQLGMREAPAALVLLADPFSFDPEACARSLDEGLSTPTCIGGMASGGQAPRSHALFVDDRTHREGAALLALSGNVLVDPIVAQGCKPIGEPMIVTRSDGHLVYSLEGRCPGEVLRELHASLSERERNLFRGSLFLGIEMRNQTEYRAGDFLIRNIVGMHEDGNALAVAAELEPYQVVQFHVRDAEASRDDLLRCLERCGQDKPAGALLFSCVGRGEHLYGVANHDSDRLRERFGELPVGGFFCNGEIGPVGGSTFLHGYTSAFGLMRPRG